MGPGQDASEEGGSPQGAGCALRGNLEGGVKNMPDQKIPAKPEKPHEWGSQTMLLNASFNCHFCGTHGKGAHLCRSTGLMTFDICRACIRLALYRMAEIPEGQS